LKRIIGLIPAAGIGARMGADRPKQYLPLGSRTLLERSVQALLADARVLRVVVVIAPGDTVAATLGLPPQCQILPLGGATRAQTVRNGLRAIAQGATPGDWVLVHDAARPCLGAADLAALIEGAGADEHGGLLALPVSDTVKREHAGRVARTEERAGLWRAQTPQFFPVAALLRALESCAENEATTDEAAAMEGLGLQPRLVCGSAENIKVTNPGDLFMAQAILQMQGRW